MICRLGGDCDPVDRSTVYGPHDGGVMQCVRCSTVYAPTGWAPRACGHCGREYGESLHDPCLGTLPGVVDACCGHGDPARAYARP